MIDDPPLRTPDQILRKLAQVFLSGNQTVAGNQEPLFQRSSPETRSCIFCGEDMSYTWRGDFRFPIYRHRDDCIMMDAARYVKEGLDRQ